MEGIGSEVSHKIRAAIKAKLIELGAYIDDELPDYIMVMVANKRSRQQMDEDLQLFLGSNTKTFTSWLHTVLQKLQEVTIANFDLKKDAQGKKCGKKKRANSEESLRKSRKSSEEKTKIGRKHPKKHKEGKKVKKAKHKNKEKRFEKRLSKAENSEGEKEKNPGKNAVDPSGSYVNNSETKSNEREFEENILKLDESSGGTGFGVSNKSDKFKNFRSDDCSSSKSSSASQFFEDPIKKTVDEQSVERRSGVVEDEFNIEPLEPDLVKDQLLDNNMNSKVQDSRSENPRPGSPNTTVQVPTRELLKEHDKIHSETEENISKDRKKTEDGSEESLSPEEIRKQLLLSRAKKKLEQSKLADRMKSNSPDIQVLENNAPGKSDDRYSLRRRRDFEEDEMTGGTSSVNENGDAIKLTIPRGTREISPVKFKYENERSEQKKNVISISKSLEMEKNFGLKNDDHKKSKNKVNSSPKKKPVSSRIVTIPEPEAPEIPSIVKVKPREYVSKEKQANKALILKAVADAEKSIATVHSRNDSEVEVKKTEALFTKNLRGKRYEKLAVTLSNVQGCVIDRDKTKRMVSVDSENANALDRKTESLQDSEVSQGLRSRPELTLKNISNKSEDQFISSKTSAMEKNDKYIHCWLEGVEKAVKDDEIVNPSEMDDYVHGHFSDEGKDDDESLQGDERKKKRMRSDEGSPVGEEKNRRTGDRSTNEGEGPQIVVTLDGLTSKAIKDIILRNRDTPNGPLLAGKKSEKSRDSKNAKHSEEENSKYKSGESVKNAGTSRDADGENREKVKGFEKISERFGRINKTSEIHEYKEKYYEFERERYEKKYLKYQGTEKEKHYEKLKEKYASAGESKNKKLIARLSEKFGKVDREFENKKRKCSEEDVRYAYSSRRIERDGKYRKLERKPVRSASDDSRRLRSKERCMFWPKCFKGKYCEFQHPS